MRSPRLCRLIASACAAGLAHAASSDDRIEALFRPPLGEWAALSPDGRRVAYTAPAGGELTIVMLGVEPTGPRRIVTVAPERREATSAEEPPAGLRFLRWATDNRLVFAPVARVVPLPPVTDAQGRLAPNPDGPVIISPILATDADGRQRGALVDAKDFQEAPEGARRTLADFLRTPQELTATRKGVDAVGWRMPHLDILGFHPRDREQIIVGTHGAHSMPLRHLVDIRTGNVQAFGDEWPAPPGAPHVYDWFRLKTVGERHAAGAQPVTLWRDDELGKIQRELDRKFPRRTVELLDWSETRARLLVRVTGGVDPGRIFVWQRTEDLMVEVFQRAPWLTAAKLNATRFHEFAAADGAKLSAWLTWPTRPRAAAPPLVVVFPRGFPGQAQPPFDPEAQVLADLGFAVARLNHRAVAGVREEDRAALRAAIDRVAVDDARAAIAWLAAQGGARTVDRGRIAAMGHGFGGWLALRALQLEPALFRGGVAVAAPADLQAWLRTPAAAQCLPAEWIEHTLRQGTKLPARAQAESMATPMLLLAEPAHEPGSAVGQPAARAAAYRRIGEFLGLHLHDHAAAPDPVEAVP